MPKRSWLTVDLLSSTCCRHLYVSICVATVYTQSQAPVESRVSVTFLRGQPPGRWRLWSHGSSAATGARLPALVAPPALSLQLVAPLRQAPLPRLTAPRSR